MTCRRSMALRRATYRVRPATLTWLGAGSPSAAATKDGAAIDEPDSTAQSVEEGAHPLAQAGVEDPHHQPQLRVEFLRPQRGVEVAQVVLAEQGERRADWTRAELNASAVSSARSMTRTRGRAAIRGP